jgi:hypothetical protein
MKIASLDTRSRRRGENLRGILSHSEINEGGINSARQHFQRNKKGRLVAPFLELQQSAYCNLNMVGRAGFEPATNWLKANCSTD